MKMMDSGIRPIDECIGGVLEGRPHIVSGGPGGGKTALALQFVHAGLQKKEGALILTDSRPDDLRSLATHIGLDLDAYIRSGRLLLLRYRDAFASRFAFAANPDLAADHLQRFAEPVMPTRIVVDSFAPFVANGGAAGSGAATLVHFLRSARATSILTYAGDLESGYDASLSPIMQEAAALFRTTRNALGGFSLEAITARYPLRSMRAAFALQQGLGIVTRDQPLQMPTVIPESKVEETALLLASTLPPSAIAS